MQKLGHTPKMGKILKIFEILTLGVKFRNFGYTIMGNKAVYTVLRKIAILTMYDLHGAI